MTDAPLRDQSCFAPSKLARPHHAQSPPAASRKATTRDPRPPPKGGDVKVDIDLDGDGRTIWYTDPLWIVLGAAAVIVVVALVAAAARGGGGTTVIR
jgi:hypothetical protein